MHTYYNIWRKSIILIHSKTSFFLDLLSGQPHEGSSYAAQKDLQMAYHRIEHVRSRLNELEKLHSDPGVPRGSMYTKNYTIPVMHMEQQQHPWQLQIGVDKRNLPDGCK